MIIKTRPFNKDADAGFIIDTMSKELYKDKHPDAKRYSKKWFTDFHEVVKSLVETADIEIAYSNDDEDFILGYAISGNHIDFVYVKENYRKQGIATLLCAQIPLRINSPYNTKLGTKIIAQFKAKEAHLTNQETPDSDSPEKKIQKLIKSGFPIRVAKFDPALSSGFGAAENEFNMQSSNKLRVPDAMYLTPVGVIIVQNGKTFGGTSYSWSV